MTNLAALVWLVVGGILGICLCEGSSDIVTALAPLAGTSGVSRFNINLQIVGQNLFRLTVVTLVTVVMLVTVRVTVVTVRVTVVTVRVTVVTVELVVPSTRYQNTGYCTPLLSTDLLTMRILNAFLSLKV